MASNVQASDFRIRDLMQPGKPVSLYIVIPPDRIPRASVIAVDHHHRAATDRGNGLWREGAERQRLLLMLDEFANLGRLEVMEESLAYSPATAFALTWYCQTFSSCTRPTHAMKRSCRIVISARVRAEQTGNRAMAVAADWRKLRW